MRTITLPKLMNVGDIHIPKQEDITLISGREYQIENIDIYRVRNVLGEGNYDIRDLCRSDRINKWAAFKPTNYPNIPSGLTFNEINGGGNWQANPVEYIKPSPEDSLFTPYDIVSLHPFILDHFAGYNHYAVVPNVDNWKINGWEIPNSDYHILQWNIPAEPVEVGDTLAVSVTINLGELGWTELEKPDTSLLNVSHVIVKGTFQTQDRYAYIKINDLVNPNNQTVILNKKADGTESGFGVYLAQNSEMSLELYFALLIDLGDPNVYADYNLVMRFPNPVLEGNAGRKRFRYVMPSAKALFRYIKEHELADYNGSTPVFAILDYMPEPYDTYQGVSGIVLHISFSGRVTGISVYVEPTKEISILGVNTLIVEVCDTNDVLTYGEDLALATWNQVSDSLYVFSTTPQVHQWDFSSMTQFLRSSDSVDILKEESGTKYVDITDLQYLAIRFRIKTP